METLKNFLAGLGAMLLVLVLGFTGVISRPTINFMYHILFVLLLIVPLLLKACSKKVNIIKQYDTVIGVEPKSNSLFFVNMYHFLYLSYNCVCGVLTPNKALKAVRFPPQRCCSGCPLNSALAPVVAS